MQAHRALLVVLLASSLAFSQTAKPRLAVKNLAHPTGHSRQSNTAGYLTEMLVSELKESGKYEVRKTSENDGERTAAGAEYVLSGRIVSFSYNEEASQESANTGTDPRMPERSCENREAWSTSIPDNRDNPQVTTMYYQTAEVRLELQLLDTATGRVVSTVSGVGQLKNRSDGSELSEWRKLASGPVPKSQLLNSMAGRAASMAIRDAVAKLTQFWTPAAS